MMSEGEGGKMTKLFPQEELPEQAAGKPKILVADLPEGQATIENIVGRDATLIAVGTLGEALQRLEGSIDMVLCGIHFDESRMFDLLRLCKAQDQSRSRPFLCYRDLESELQSTLLESLDISCRALGAAGFVDLYTLKRRYGIDQADREFAKLIFSCLDGGGEA
jgi:hypothetical protein